MKILVALDLSDGTKKVVAAAADLARPIPDAKLWLLHVAAPDPDFIGYDVGPQTVRDNVAKSFHKEHQHIQDLAADLRNQGLDAVALLVQGQTVATVMKEIAGIGGQIIVVGSHGHGAVYELLVGSTCEGILHKSECPVLVVPTR